MVQRLKLKAVIKLTNGCNLRCAYCYQASSLPEGGRISRDILRRILHQLSDYALLPVSILWYGGEPTAVGYEFFRETIEAANSIIGEVRHSIQTNAVLIDERWSALLAQHNFGVTVSLDGPPSFHDLQRPTARGGPTHNQVLKAIENLQKAGINPRIACVVTEKSVDQAEELLEYFAQLGIKEVDFPPALRFSNSTSLQAFVSPERYAEFLNRIFRHWLKLNRKDFRVRSLVGIARRLAGRPGHYCKLEGDCSRYITFATDGTVYPCDEFSGFEGSCLGDLTRETLRDILLKPHTRELFHSWSALPAECLNCRWVSQCPGTCPFERRANGALDTTSIMCTAWKSIFETMHDALFPGETSKTDGIPCQASSPS